MPQQQAIEPILRGEIMDKRFQEIYAHLSGLYPGMSGPRRMAKAAKMLSKELGPFHQVSDDGTVVDNPHWKKHMNQLDRQFYNKVWNWLGQTRSDLPATERERISVQAVKDVRAWVASPKHVEGHIAIELLTDDARRGYIEREVYNGLVQKYKKPTSYAFDVGLEDWLKRKLDQHADRLYNNSL